MVVYEFEEEEKAQVLVAKKKKQQNQVMLMLLILGAGAFYYFSFYLPEEEIKKLEKQLQGEIDKVQNLSQDPNFDDKIAEMLAKLQSYQLWANGNDFQKKALINKQNEFNQVIQWLQSKQKTPQQIENEYFLKGRIWSLLACSWADRELRKSATYLVKAYGEEVNQFPNGDKNKEFYFTRSASYDIKFPPSLQENHEKGKSAGETSEILNENESLIWSDKVRAWYNQVKDDPTRGTIEKDNNALFYGAPGTGKTATVKKLCFEVNKCPLVIVKGSSLTPTKQDYDASFGPLQKFIYTISSLEWILVKNFCLPRKPNGEVHYILFVDEADQTSNNILLHDPNKLKYLKDCLEGGATSRKNESQNLWVMATNHLKDIDDAAYRKGRLSNKLDFSWNWHEFKKYVDDARANPGKYKLPNWFNIPSIPQKWQDTKTLNEKDNKLINKFNIDNFVKDFLGHDPKEPQRPKFWETFITNNPDAILKEEISKEDENGNETIEIEEREIDIGEFFQFFWQKQENSELGAYDGKFKSPRIPETAEVLADNLPNLEAIADLLAKSSNALNQSLENIAEELESIGARQDDSVRDDIRELRQDLVDLAQEVRQRR